MTTVRSKVCPQVRTVFSPKRLAKIDPDLPEIVKYWASEFRPPYKENKPLVYRVGAGKNGLYVTAGRQLSTVESKKVATPKSNNIIDRFLDKVLGLSKFVKKQIEITRPAKGIDFIPKREYEHGFAGRAGLLNTSMHGTQRSLKKEESFRAFDKERKIKAANRKK